MPRRLAAAIFDLNGTIVDDTAQQRWAWTTTAKRFGVALSREDYEQSVAGRAQADVLDRVFGPALAGGRKDEILALKQCLYQQLDPADAEVPGFRALLDDLDREDIPVGLATSSSEATMDFLLDGLRIRDVFDVIVRAEDVRHGKPAPDIYLEAARRLGVRPADCAVFEDSPSGVRSAKSAGMVCIGLATSRSPHQLVLDGADHTSTNYDGLRFPELRRILDQDGRN